MYYISPTKGYKLQYYNGLMTAEVIFTNASLSIILEEAWDSPMFTRTEWLTILGVCLTLALTIAIYMLQERRAISARDEREKRAHGDLLDIIENHIINKQEISEEYIYDLFGSLDREYGTTLRNTYTPIMLLQDMALRIEKSKHLDIQQKEAYIDQLEEKIVLIKESHKKIPEIARQSLALADTLEDAMKSDEKEKGLEILKLLKEELIRTSPLQRAEPMSVSALAKALIVSIIITLFVISAIELLEPQAEESPIFILGSAQCDRSMGIFMIHLLNAGNSYRDCDKNDFEWFLDGKNMGTVDSIHCSYAPYRNQEGYFLEKDTMIILVIETEVSKIRSDSRIGLYFRKKQYIPIIYHETESF